MRLVRFGVNSLQFFFGANGAVGYSRISFCLLLMVGLSGFISYRGLADMAHTLRLLDAQNQEYVLEERLPELNQYRVVFIGEYHDRYHHHLAQQAVMAALHQAGERQWAVGLEFIQQPFQSVLDAYTAGSIDEIELLAQTEYFERWGFDYRLYRPIFRYAREQGLPLVALNVATELVNAVRESGWEGLSPEQRAQLPPTIPPMSAERRAELAQFYAQHPPTSGDFERFVQVQQLWDASMAQRAAEYLQAHPEQGLVVLAGQGHLVPGSGIPERLQQHIDVPTVILMPVDTHAPEQLAWADYRLLLEPIELPPAGRMGVRLEFDDGARALEVVADSAAARAGMQVGDQILSIAQRPIATWSDVRLALLDRQPGDEISVIVQRAERADLITLSLRLD